MALADKEHFKLPQIGVLCIDVAKQLLEMFPHDTVRSYIPSSYIQFIEAAGAEAVPVWIGYERAYYEKILTKLNGVLIPGGAVNFRKTPQCDLPNDCVQSSKYIYEIAKQQNDEGVYFPLWGTCLGFQLIVQHSVGSKGEVEVKDEDEVRVICERMDCSAPICFEANFCNSKMFANLSDRMTNLMETEHFGYHYHRYCITRKSLQNHHIDEEWQILATNRDEKDLEFITFAEHKRYPFYGTQVHLERIAYEILPENDKCLHTERCIEVGNYFSSFFVSECRKSSNEFDNDAERRRHSIRNFKVKSTRDQLEAHWLDCYLFGARPKYPE